MENETGEVSRKMNNVLARAACDFEDDTRRRQDIAKDIENEIAITYCRRRVLAMIGHLPRTLNGFGPPTRRAFVAEVSLDSVRGVYGTASLSHHCRNHATSLDVTATPSLIARLRLAMNRGSVRFVGLFERSASWRPAQ